MNFLNIHTMKRLIAVGGLTWGKSELVEAVDEIRFRGITMFTHFDTTYKVSELSTGCLLAADDLGFEHAVYLAKDKMVRSEIAGRSVVGLLSSQYDKMINFGMVFNPVIAMI